MVRPFPGIAPELSRLAAIYALVAVVSGRREEEIRRLLDPPGVVIFGLYGLEGEDDQAAPPPELRLAMAALANRVPGAWVEDKGASLALHYRLTPNPEEAESMLGAPVAELAARYGRALVLGKMVFELVPASTPGKGRVVLREALARRLSACLYAGDDQADLEAFAALDELRDRGMATVKVAVRSAEAPARLIESADLTLDVPAAVLELLRSL